MKQPRPVVNIKKQPMTNTPVRSDSTIMDDTVMTMDGSALMGGPVAIVGSVAAKVVPFRYYTKVKKRR